MLRLTKPPTMLELTDTHCHIQSSQNPGGGEAVTLGMWRRAGFPAAGDILERARGSGVSRLVCVGCDLADSALAVEFAAQWQQVWASVGLHPHEARRYVRGNQMLPDEARRFAALSRQAKVVAVGECGLDYHYSHSPREAQVTVLRFQIELALERGLPLIFHVREAFDDFWPIVEKYRGVRGVLHSFTDSRANMERAVKKGLYIGVNGIATFCGQESQLNVYRAVPSDKLLLETDAPFLTPAPYRGTVCEPHHIKVTAEFLAGLRGEPVERLAASATANAQQLFGFSE